MARMVAGFGGVKRLPMPPSPRRRYPASLQDAGVPDVRGVESVSSIASMVERGHLWELAGTSPTRNARTPCTYQLAALARELDEMRADASAWPKRPSTVGHIWESQTVDDF